MKILIIRETELQELSPRVMAQKGLAGTENSVVCLAQTLAKDHIVKVICPGPRSTYQGVEYIPYEGYGTTAILMSIFNPDVVVVSGNPSLLFQGLSFPGSLKKFIFWQQNHPAELVGRFDIKLLLSRPDVCIVAPSPEAALYYRNFYKEGPNRIHGIYNGVRSEFYKVARNPVKNRIVYCGSFTRAKGLSSVLEAAERLPEYHFRLCGAFDLYGFQDKLYTEYCQHLAKDLDNIHFAGSLSAENLAQEMASAEICIVNPLVGNHETCCVSALESMAVGTPVLAGSGLISPIIHNGGITFEGPLSSFVEKIKWFMKNPSAMERLSETGKEFAKELSWELISKKWTSYLMGKTKDAFSAN